MYMWHEVITGLIGISCSEIDNAIMLYNICVCDFFSWILGFYDWDREIEEVYSGRLPHLHAQASCRCPPSHPRVHPLVERYCIPNAADDTTNNRVLRLNLDAHPLHYINDNDIGTSWVSSILSTTEKLDEGVTITINLENGQYQVFIFCFRSSDYK